ncbi:MAG: copper chaperone PCu(A)C [Nitrospirae bacterium]|nr:copper chaperone PCu(A)C [Nitrospirota bacterium]
MKGPILPVTKRIRAGLIIWFVTVLSGMAGGGGCSRFPQIHIENPEARLSSTMVGVCSIFLTIENSGNGGDSLVGARVNIPGTVTELHDVKDGKMVRREKISVPAASVLQLRPGRRHIMVFKIPEDIKESHEFVLALTFEKSGEKQVSMVFSRTPHRQ